MTILCRSTFHDACGAAAGPKRPTGPFFSQLTSTDRRNLTIVGEVISYVPGSTIFAQGAPAARCFTVIEGVLALARRSEDQRRQIVAFALPGDMLEFSVLQRHELQGFAVGEALVWEVARKDFESFAAPRPHVVNILRSTIASVMRENYIHMFALGRMSAEERVIGFLGIWQERLRALGASIDPLPLPMSRKELGDHLGALQILPGGVKIMALHDGTYISSRRNRASRALTPYLRELGGASRPTGRSFRIL
jgi:CRP-like cAMP-binding protein